GHALRLSRRVYRDAPHEEGDHEDGPVAGDGAAARHSRAAGERAAVVGPGGRVRSMSDGAKVLLGVLGIFGVSVLAGVAGLVLVYAVATADEPDSGVDRDKALAELRARDRAREERLQEARRALPPEGAVPPDWTLD